MGASLIPDAVDQASIRVGGREVRLTHLNKPFWPALGITKRELLRYYESVAPALLPHLRDRPMVMKRYPHGWEGEFFFMKRAPVPRPEWIETVKVVYRSGNVIDFPMVQELASLLWTVNLGCIDLNPWYSRRDALDLPDYLHFDLDPGAGVPFARVRELALRMRELLESLGMRVHAKTTGSKGMHLYVGIARGPAQKQVWGFAKAFALEVERRLPALATAAYKVASRPAGRVLVDYNQNRWDSTLSSVYSVRPRPLATVSTPVTWQEVERGVEIEQFTLRNVPGRLARLGDLWVAPFGGRRFDLGSLLVPPSRASRPHV